MIGTKIRLPWRGDVRRASRFQPRRNITVCTRRRGITGTGPAVIRASSNGSPGLFLVGFGYGGWYAPPPILVMNQGGFFPFGAMTPPPMMVRGPLLPPPPPGMMARNAQCQHPARAIRCEPGSS